MRSFFLVLSVLFSRAIGGVNFPFESVQLTDADTKGFPGIAFGNSSAASLTYKGPNCKAYPGTTLWPANEEWQRLNTSLDGVLLKPEPPGVVCYDGPFRDLKKCDFLMHNAFGSRFYIDDPLTVLTSWPQGETCVPSVNAQGNCTQGGFPVYVVNATTVKQIQIAVNFARNNNIRLIIKNTGHDFVGRSTGGGALSIWTHHLKHFEFLPRHTQDGGNYNSSAARVGSGLEAWELYQYMDMYNMTLVVPGGSTVGAYGGWMAGGGHSTLGSLYGLGSDQVLSIEVVTADGHFVTADPETNSDLFFALRGGGPGTYGVVTSAIVKAYPPVSVAETPIRFSVGTFGWNNATTPSNSTVTVNTTATSNPASPSNTPWPTNGTVPSNQTRPFNRNRQGSGVLLNDTTTFWTAVNTYFAFGAKLCDAGGTGYSYVSSGSNNSFSFNTNIELPGMTKQDAFAFLQPLFDDLNAAGVRINNTLPVTSLSWGSTRKGEGDAPGNTRFATRLWPRRNWDGGPSFEAMMKSIRGAVEAGYSFHGVQVAPGDKTVGYPGGSAVNPAFRQALMHADLFDRGGGYRGARPEVRKEARARFNAIMDTWRAASPGAGAYINEADPEEPDWQTSFFGEHYGRLLNIKKKWDPWGVFWAPTTVGSEDWEVRTEDGLRTQNGPLCRVEKTSS